nr:cAMP-dependent protein kinase catalytic subunit PRKX [Loxodonta africana]
MPTMQMRRAFPGGAFPTPRAQSWPSPHPAFVVAGSGAQTAEAGSGDHPSPQSQRPAPASARPPLSAHARRSGRSAAGNERGAGRSATQHSEPDPRGCAAATTSCCCSCSDPRPRPAFVLARRSGAGRMGAADDAARAALELRSGSLDSRSAEGARRRDSRGDPDGAPRPEAGWLQDLHTLSTMGTGTFGRVRLVREKTAKGFFALKVMSIPDVIRLKQEQHVQNEKSVLGEVNHPLSGCESPGVPCLLSFLLLSLPFSPPWRDNPEVPQNKVLECANEILSV